MAIPKISKMVTTRQRHCERLEQLVKAHGKEVAAALERLLDDEEKKDGEGLDGKAILERLMGRLSASLGELVAAEEQHLDELANDAEPRQRRDDTVAELRRVLLDMRSLLRCLYGPEAAEELGFERRIASQPWPLLRQAQRVEAQLRDPKVELPAPRYERLALDRPLDAEVIGNLVKALHQALKDVNREEAKAQHTKLAKDRAMDTFDDHYLLLSHLLVTALRLGGQPVLAAKIPTSLRRRPRRKAKRAEI